MPGPFSNWNPLEHYVQGGLVDGKFVSGGLTLLAAGPPRLSQLGGGAAADSALIAAAGAEGETIPAQDIVYPIGLTQNVNHSQNKTFVRAFELGSDRSYFIGSRTVGQIALSRIYYDGASLLRILYAYYEDMVGTVQVPAMFANIGAQAMPNEHDVIVPPGYENLFLNLASDLFNQPIGMLIYLRNSNLKTLGAIYLECCTIPNHTWSTDAQGTIVQETVALQYERIVPVNVGVALITGFDNAVEGVRAAA